MKRVDVLRKLSECQAELDTLGVASLSLFGSVARDDAVSTSDIDLLVEFREPVGLFGYYELKERLERILGAQVDLATPAGLKARIRDRVLYDAIHVT